MFYACPLGEGTYEDWFLFYTVSSCFEGVSGLLSVWRTGGFQRINSGCRWVIIHVSVVLINSAKVCKHNDITLIILVQMTSAHI